MNYTLDYDTHTLVHSNVHMQQLQVYTVHKSDGYTAIITNSARTHGKSYIHTHIHMTLHPYTYSIHSSRQTLSRKGSSLLPSFLLYYTQCTCSPMSTTPITVQMQWSINKNNSRNTHCQGPPYTTHTGYKPLYDTCVGGSKLERKVYHAFLIRLFVNHSYDNQQ